MPKNEVSDPITVQQQLVQQDVEELRPLSPNREQVLARLWELAHLSPEMTRNSITGQVKAISIIVAMQNFIPDRRALSAEKKSAPAPVNAQIYEAAWLREQRAAAHATTNDPQPTPAPTQQEDAPPNPVPSQPTFGHRVPLAEGQPPHVPLFNSVPDTRVPHSIKKNPFARFR